MDFPQGDMVLLGHMLEASEWVVRIALGRTQEEIDQDLILFLALVKAIEVVGEAASQASETTQNATPEIPWRRIVGMRNRLVHGYDDIDIGIIWLVAQEHAPTLIDQLRQLLPDDFAPIPLR